jgi:methyltransferase, FkbM family
MSIVDSRWSLGGGKSVVLCTWENAVDPYSVRVRESWSVEANVLLAASLIDPQTSFFDFGANIGAFSIPLALLSGARGVAVEALPRNLQLLERAILLNGVDVKVVNGAISDSDGTVFFSGESAYGHISSQGTGIEVTCFSADTLVGDLFSGDIPGLVKVDIEGSELACFSGGKKLFGSQSLRHVIFEANGPHCVANGYMPQDLIRVLEGFGFDCFLIDGHTLARRDSRSFQEFGNCDYLATRDAHLLDHLPGYKLGELDESRRIQEIVRACTGMKPQYAAFMRVQRQRVELSPSISRQIDHLFSG